ncbi:hypothetical protein NQ315_007437 [Exocentrus adspersus]|uniref:Uncharacterized protein n=1 Tax=Exocentrus adspersus TaxID=1586481 RepID=A0AAV8VI10_9CUCU|nr:hypothetical protein NQ315_007437 [Exocentrus adspersus]
MFGNLGFLNEFDFRDNYTYIKIKKEEKYQYEDAETDRSNGVRPLLIDHAFIEDCRIKTEEEIEIKPDFSVRGL